MSFKVVLCQVSEIDLVNEETLHRIALHHYRILSCLLSTCYVRDTDFI